MKFIALLDDDVVLLRDQQLEMLRDLETALDAELVDVVGEEVTARETDVDMFGDRQAHGPSPLIRRNAERARKAKERAANPNASAKAKRRRKRRRKRKKKSAGPTKPLNLPSLSPSKDASIINRPETVLKR